VAVRRVVSGMGWFGGVGGLFGRRPRVLAGAVSSMLVLSLLWGVPPVAASPGKPGGPSKASVAVGRVTTRKPRASQTDTAGIRRVDHASLPAAGSAAVSVTGGAVSVGGLGVALSTRR
jgi:hypothetical protein